MATLFDPYLLWLSIRAPERPPNHYRLLGVMPFEEDPQVLANAAERQMAYVRTFAAGEHAAESQQVLGELAAALQCLTNAEAKASYDAQLRSKDARRSVAVRQMLQEPPVFVRTSSLPRNRAFLRKNSVLASLALVLLGSAVVIAAVFFAVAKMNATRREAEASARNRPLGEPVTPISESQRLAEASAKKQKQTAAAPKPLATVAKPPAPKQSPAQPKPVESNGSPQNGRENSPAAAPPTRYDVPRDQAQEKALAEIRSVFADRYTLARARDDNRGLARILFHQASETRDDPTVRFVLYTESRDLALAAGDTKLLVDVMTKMGTEYQLDWHMMATEILTKAASKPHDLVTSQSLGRLMLELARGASDREDYPQAMQLIKAGKELSRKAHDDFAVKQFAATASDLDDRAQLRLLFHEVAKTLAEKPDDPQANQIAARYYCRVKNDWRQGLSLLLKGDDAAIRKPAAAELAAAPRTTNEMLALGDVWYESLAAVADANRRLARLRTIYWYEKALPGLTGFTRKKVERQLSELSE